MLYQIFSFLFGVATLALILAVIPGLCDTKKSMRKRRNR